MDIFCPFKNMLKMRLEIIRANKSMRAKLKLIYVAFNQKQLSCHIIFVISILQLIKLDNLKHIQVSFLL